MKKPLILVINDDGITAPGIRSLVEAIRDMADVVVVAPDSPQSGQSHSITLTTPLKYKAQDIFDGVEAYSCSGTPVDCFKIARHCILKERKIDLCVSGINHGSNASINVIYSGTMAAATEAAVCGIDAIGFSSLDHAEDADFEPCKKYIRQLVQYAFDKKLGKNNLLNVNIPKLPSSEIKGIKICRQALSYWKETFTETIDPRGSKYYWLDGTFTNQDTGEDTDIWALENGYVSVVPCTYDLTNHKAIDALRDLEQQV